jgi:hypothetical protein
MDVVARASRRLFPWALLLFLAVGARAEMVFKPLLGVSALSGHTTYDISFAGYDLLLDPTGGRSGREQVGVRPQGPLDGCGA